MEITCPECHRKLAVPDEKIPRNARFVLSCPGCKGKIPVDTREELPESFLGFTASQENEIEFFEEGSKKGLVCVADEAVREQVMAVLRELEYKTSPADDLRGVSNKLRYNHYDLIVVNDKSGDGGAESNPILKYIERLPISIRRNIFVLLVSSQYRTLDSLRAFSLSVDAIIHASDLANMREILRKSLLQQEQFYKVFKTRLKAARQV